MSDRHANSNPVRVWGHDRPEGVWVAAAHDGTPFVGLEMPVFESEQIAQDWCDDFNQGAGLVLLVPRFIGYSRYDDAYDPHATPDRAAIIKAALLDVNENGGTRRWDDYIDVLAAHIDAKITEAERV